MPSPRLQLMLLLALAMTACDSGVDNDNPNLLSGSWHGQGNVMVASADSASFREACMQATFAPITLDSARRFTVESTTLLELGNLRIEPGDKMHINGQLSGNTLSLTVYLILVDGPASDPISIQLTEGGGQPGFCPA